MGRISKRNRAIDGEGAAVQGRKCYRAGIYARLSASKGEETQDFFEERGACEDSRSFGLEGKSIPRDSKCFLSEGKSILSEGKSILSDGLEVQIQIAEKYVEEWNRNHKDKIEIIGRYADSGKTGTNFDRDAFRRLMQDVRMGDINCIIVKDLSRFGRNYLEAGNYIERIFPFLGVRFIAVADGYDTGVDGNHAGQIASEIKNLVNDMYARDFSAKAKLSLKQRRDNGSYVGGPPPYGYEAYWEGRVRRLRPDGNTAEIVRIIYEKFVKAESCQAVADYLNQRRINPPAVYRKEQQVYCPAGTEYKGWDRGAVERILKSETYFGGLVQGKTSMTARKEENRVKRPEKDWVRKENAHEPLIDVNLYEKAAEIRCRIHERTLGRQHPTEGTPIGENIFDSVLYCGVCGRKLTRNSYVKHYADGRKERKEGYFCIDSIGTKTERCPDVNRISRTELTDILSVLFQTEFAIRLKRQKDYVEEGRQLISQKRKELEQKMRQVESRLSALAEEDAGKYMSYRMNHLTQEDYVSYRLRRDDAMEELEKQKGRYQEEMKCLERKGEAYLKTVRALIGLKKQKALTKGLVEALVERIHVYPGKRVETVFTYMDIQTERTVRYGK